MQSCLSPRRRQESHTTHSYRGSWGPGAASTGQATGRAAQSEAGAGPAETLAQWAGRGLGRLRGTSIREPPV
jgi:hypothetical protein